MMKTVLTLVARAILIYLTISDQKTSEPSPGVVVTEKTVLMEKEETTLAGLEETMSELEAVLDLSEDGTVLGLTVGRKSD